ncbi:hypothetical protein CDD83_3134 [Cordyceps sp. RAO-2017]|nr:hypothetical protein CDD83_3134 [Cordyceps sp. RAO-2017]
MSQNLKSILKPGPDMPMDPSKMDDLKSHFYIHTREWSILHEYLIRIDLTSRDFDSIFSAHRRAWCNGQRRNALDRWATHEAARIVIEEAKEYLKQRALKRGEEVPESPAQDPKRRKTIVSISPRDTTYTIPAREDTDDSDSSKYAYDSDSDEDEDDGVVQKPAGRGRDVGDVAMTEENVAATKQKVSVTDKDVAVTGEKVAVTDKDVPMSDENTPMTGEDVAMTEQSVAKGGLAEAEEDGLLAPFSLPSEEADFPDLTMPCFPRNMSATGLESNPLVLLNFDSCFEPTPELESSPEPLPDLYSGSEQEASPGPEPKAEREAAPEPESSPEHEPAPESEPSPEHKATPKPEPQE